MPMYNLIEYNDNYLKMSGTLQQYCIDAPNGSITDFKLFKLQSIFTNNTVSNGTVDVEIDLPLKYLGNLWRTPELSLDNCEINLILTWPENYIVSKADSETTVPVIFCAKLQGGGVEFQIFEKKLSVSFNYCKSMT